MYKKSLLMIASLAVFSSGAALASPANDACAALMDARGNLVKMLDSTDRAANDGLKANIAAATARLDATLAAMARGSNADDAAKVAAFKPTWDEFKAARDGEIVPLIYAGKNADAKAIGTGIQAQRMGRMRAAMGCK